MGPLLSRIEYPGDIKSLTITELRQLCAEIRDYMVECCSVNPGHLGSSLGAVELIVAWHYVFDAPEDKLVFDVGHQAYAHKILTGRKEAFRANRTEGGISGFPNIFESEYDAFGVGHSSTSISAALGMAEAAAMQGRSNKITALIGDGALTGGLALEGLNNAGARKTNLLVILNDNDQAIDSNQGSLHNHLLKVTTSVRYNRFKERVWDTMGNNGFRAFLQRWVKGLKAWIVKGSGGDLFESLGFRYFGPIDGNDIEQTVNTLKRLKNISGPCLLHCCTVKGKGYAPAENDPVTWHAPGKFDPQSGERIKSTHSADRYQDVFGKVLCELAEKDSRVVGITPAMATGCGMNVFAQQFPERFFDVGIEEEHAVTFSSGLAAGGMRPFCNIYSTFSQRAYDQIIHDAALQKLPVVFCFDRAGLVGEDGATHQGAFDLAAYRSIPDIVVSAPKDETELKDLMYSALKHEGGPYIIRYPRGCGEGSAWKETPYKLLETGKAEELSSGSEIAAVATGPVVNRALEAASSLEGKVGVYNFRFVKPLDCEMLDRIAEKYKVVVTLEDGSLKGGLFGAVCEYMASRHPGTRIEGVGIPDKFMTQATQARQREICGLDSESIEKRFKKILDNKN